MISFIMVIISFAAISQASLDTVAAREWTASAFNNNAALCNEYMLLEPEATPLRSMKTRSTLLDVVAVDDHTILRKAKIMTDENRWKKENAAYKAVIGSGRKAKDNRHPSFITKYLSQEIEGSGGFLGCLILEAGITDLKQLSATLGPIEGAPLLALARGMMEAMTRMHSRGFVWTDLKVDNFVLTNCGEDIEGRSLKIGPDCIVKAIDLESSVGFNSPIQDFSPEVVAPEQLDALLSGEMTTVNGRAKDLKINVNEPMPMATPSLDVWALGVSILHLHLGRAPISDDPNDVKTALSVMRDFRLGKTDLGLSEVRDPALAKLLASMLVSDASARPSTSTLKNKSYFRGR